MTIHLEMKFAAILLCVGALPLFLSANSLAQDKQDPTAQSDVIKQTISKIKEVEKLDSYIAQNAQLTATNKQLQGQIASINKQVAALTKELADQQAKLRKQLLQMPSFELKAKVIGNGQGMAILKSKERYFRIRSDTKMSVPVADGVYVLMEVKEISKEVIELHFPELERDLFLYD
jgi:predicted nuclease with TOPRIM domain